MGKKSNPFNQNPLFGGNDSSDPFQDASVPPASSAPWPADRGSAWGSSSQPATIPLDNGFSSANGGGEGQLEFIKKKEALDRREKDLNAREAELTKQRQELEASGAIKRKKNWPIFYPITYHDIGKEVPAENRWPVRFCYWAYLGFLVAVSWNLFAALLALCAINPGSGRLAGFLLAAIYWFAGVPGAWVLWYARIYHLAIKDRAILYAWFFLMFIVHIAFCIVAAISPSLPTVNGWSLAGFLTCTKAFDAKTFIGVLYVIGGALWALEALWSIWALKSVYFSFRNGTAPGEMKQEAAGAFANRVLGRGGSKQASSSTKPNFGAGDV